MDVLESLTCPRCSAPLPPGAAGDVVTCGHCGTASRIKGPAHHRVAQPVGASSGAPALVVLAAVIGVAATGVTIAVVILSAPIAVAPAPSPGVVEAPAPFVPYVPAPRPEPPPPEPTALPWTALATAEVDRWVVIEPPPLSTPPDDFAPNAHIEWAEKIAGAWSPDSVLVRMDVAGVRRDGGLDLANDPDAKLRYVTVSPTRLAAARELAKVTRDFAPTSVVVSLDEGVASVMISDHWQMPEGARPPVRSPCTLAQVLAAGGSDLAELPDHEVRLDWREPYAGLPAWLFDVDGDFYVFPEDCVRWTLPEARRRR